MKKDYTHIVILLDKSGSMKKLINDTVGGFNTLLEDQKKEKGKATVSLYHFNGGCRNVYSFVDINEVAELTEDNYKPLGSTALYDALNQAINETGNELNRLSESQRPSKVLVISITDGEENASSTSSYTVKSQIEHQTNRYNWEFVFVGANQDAVLNARKIGIAASNAFTYDFSPIGTKSAFEAISNVTASYRAGGEINFDTERKNK